MVFVYVHLVVYLVTYFLRFCSLILWFVFDWSFEVSCFYSFYGVIVLGLECYGLVAFWLLHGFVYLSGLVVDFVY